MIHVPLLLVGLSIRHTYSAVGSLYVNTHEYPVCSATAVAYKNGYFAFLTAGHCITGVRDSFENPHLFIGSDDPNGTLYPVLDLAYHNDAQHDWAIVLIQAPKNAFTVVKIGKRPAHLGEKVFSISTPSGEGKQYTPGVITNLAVGRGEFADIEGSDWRGWIGIASPGVGPGSSGAALFCGFPAKVCGVVIGRVATLDVVEPPELIGR